MASEYINKIRTKDGAKQINYNALANLPDLTQKADKTDLYNHSGLKLDDTGISFKYGGLNVGVPYDTNARIRTEYILLTKGSRIDFEWENPNCLLVISYGMDGIYITGHGKNWNDGNNSFVLTEDSFVIIVLRKSESDDTITDSDMTSMVENLRVYRNTENDFVESTTSDLQLLSGYGLDINGFYSKTTTSIVMDMKSFYKIKEGTQSITAYCDFKSGMYFRFYDENLQALGNGGQTEAKTATINILASNNPKLTKDAKYLKLGFYASQYYDGGYTVSNVTPCVLVKERSVLETIENKEIDYSDYTIKMQQMQENVDRTSNSFVLVHFSDIHGDFENLQRIVKFSDTYSEYIDDVIHTGDSIKTDITNNTFDFWKSVSGSQNILNCIGNHDVWSEADYGTYGYTQSEAYAAYIKDYIDNWNVSYTENCNYYYKDYASKNIRLIVLDCMFDTEEQQTWFANTLTGAKDLGYTVVCVNHIAFTPPTNDNKALNTLSSPFTYSYHMDNWNRLPYEFMNDIYPSAVDTFISNGGSFACWLFGHKHCCGIGTLTFHPKQMFTIVSNAGTTGANDGGSHREKDTKSQDSFNVVAIDTVRKCVKIMAVGSQYDKEMRYRDTISYDYMNHEIIYPPSVGVEILNDVTTTDVVITELKSNSEKVYGEVTSISVTFPASVGLDYASSIIFSTPATLPENYTTFPSDVYFKGDECDGGIFIPNASTRYTMLFYYDGTKIIGLVSGIEVTA